MDVLQAIESGIATAAERTGPAVVGRGTGWDVGSGFVVAPGEILVTAHGLRSEETSVSFADGRRAGARVIGSDREYGLALVAADTGDLEPVPWKAGTDGEEVEPPGIGRPVVALASPGGRGLRATLGFVACAPRSFRGPRGRRLSGGIEHTAPLPRGSAGGPLVDLDGRLLGINAVRTGGGLILAVAADNALRQRLDGLREGQAFPARRLGVAVAPPRVARRLRGAVGLPEREGLLVRGVEEESAGQRAGVRPGDLIVAVDGREVSGVDVLHEALDGLAPRTPLRLGVVRGADELELAVDFPEGSGSHG